MWLTGPEALQKRTQILGANPSSSKVDPLVLSKQLKDLDPHLRRALSEWMGLHSKIAQKFKTEAPLVLDTFAYEQSTAADLGQWKAKLLAVVPGVVDYCCGMGADSMWISPEIPVVGVDLSPERLWMSRRNHALLRPGGPFWPLLADAGSEVLDNRASGDWSWMGDPDRRGGERHGQWDLSRLRPGLEIWQRRAALNPHGLLKLPPAAAENQALEVFGSVSRCALFAGDRASCRELLLCGGRHSEALLKPFAGHLDLEDARLRLVLDAPSSQIFGGIQHGIHVNPGPVGAWIAEPAPGILRAGLVHALARDLGAWPLEAQGAYLCSDQPIESVFWNPWRVVDVQPLDVKILSRKLRDLGFGPVALKRRPGLDLDTDQWGKKLSAPKGIPGVVFAVRIAASEAGQKWMGVIATRAEI
jgi:hypothetical protein